ncbi:MAG: Transrane protein, partial [Verrucomicrobiota bacterium]
MRNIAQIYFFLYALITAAFGVQGFLKAQSKPSLIAGVASGILLAVAASILPSKPGAGATVGIVTAILLLGRFLPTFLKKGAIMPAG